MGIITNTKNIIKLTTLQNNAQFHEIVSFGCDEFCTKYVNDGEYQTDFETWEQAAKNNSS